MRTLILAVAVFLVVPALRAQQDEAKETPQATSHETKDSSNTQDNLPASIRPGHPLDSADVDVLTGKRDREIEASRRAASGMMGGVYYSTYGDYYAMNGPRSAAFDLPLLPLTRISNPFFFSTIVPRGFGRGGFRGRR